MTAVFVCLLVYTPKIGWSILIGLGRKWSRFSSTKILSTSIQIRSCLISSLKRLTAVRNSHDEWQIVIGKLRGCIKDGWIKYWTCLNEIILHKVLFFMQRTTDRNTVFQILFQLFLFKNWYNVINGCLKDKRLTTRKGYAQPRDKNRVLQLNY